MNAKEQLKEKIDALVTENKMLKEKITKKKTVEETIEEPDIQAEDISEDETVEDTMPDDMTEGKPQLEEEVVDEEVPEEEPTMPIEEGEGKDDMYKVVEILEQLSKRVEALEGGDEEVVEEEVVEENAPEETEEESVDDADQIGATKDTATPNDNPETPEKTKQTTGAKEDNITKNEAVDEETPAKKPEEEETPAEKPVPPKIESIRNLKIESTFNRNPIREAVKNLF